jgi:hypothetical protein
MAKKTEKPEEQVKTTRETHTLKCSLTDKELLSHGEDLATALDNLRKSEDEKKSVVESFKAQQARLEADIAAKQLLVRNKWEFRKVDCNLVMNYSTQTATLIRLDTDEVVNERKMTHDELQLDLGFDGQDESEAA